eukprot:TRINITY_DN25625_c0_g1_i1.p1 TRINITY_DN25625_c0_g1~~TRINITY_DN25625_c0_g1_i1.p1  ORF type:complete len:536 (+),score=155.64 TRINITY_DN25625_c0_g1_i1:106-1713(+)
MAAAAPAPPPPPQGEPPPGGGGEAEAAAAAAAAAARDRLGGAAWPPSPDSRENYRKYYYPPVDRSNPMRPVRTKSVCVDRQRGTKEHPLLREWAKRLAGSFTSLSALQAHIDAEFDPCRTGFIGLGDFLCLWFKRRTLTARRPYIVQLGVMGLQPPVCVQRQHTVMVAAVAAALGAHCILRDMERTEADTRFSELNFAGERAALERAGVWYGGWSWRDKPPLPQDPAPPDKSGGDPQLARMLRDPDAKRHELDGQQVYFTPFLLYKLRSHFEKYDENDGGNPADATAHIRFGMVASFLYDIAHDSDLGPYFAMTGGEMGSFLNDLVRHANDSMRDLREEALERRQRAEEAGGLDSSISDTDDDWDPTDDDVIAGMLERARACLRQRRPRQAQREAKAILERYRRQSARRAPPPYFEEPAFNFCNILALLLKYMVDSGQSDEVLGFFNDGIGLFYTLLGHGSHGPPDPARPRVLPVRVLLREFSHLELGHPNSTAFGSDASWPCFAGPMCGGWDPDRVPARRKMPASGGLSVGGAM